MHTRLESPTPDNRFSDQSEEHYEKQMEKVNLELEVQKLKQQLADTQNQLPQTQRRHRRRLQAPEISDEDLRSQVLNIAHKFTYMSLLWLNQPTETFELEPDDDYDPHDRFSTEEAWLQGQKKDLLDSIPVKLHTDISDIRFVNTFVQAMNQQRSNASTRVRAHCGAAIFGCTSEEYTDRANRFKQLIGWTTQDDGTESGYYVPFAPILFKNYANRNDKWKIFRNPILMRTYAALVLGPSSVKNTKNGQIFIRDSSHCNVETLWGIRQITPAAIAMSAILARFSASSDVSFQPVGAITGIEYQEDYRTYLQYLSEGLRLNKPSVLDIFKQWNQAFYLNLPDLPKQLSQTKPSNIHRDAVLEDLYNEEEDDVDQADEQPEATTSRVPAVTVMTLQHQSSEQERVENIVRESEIPNCDSSQRPSSPLSEPSSTPLCPQNANLSPQAPVRSKKRKVVTSDSEAEGDKENAPARKVHRSGNKGKNVAPRARRATRNMQKSQAI